MNQSLSLKRRAIPTWTAARSEGRLHNKRTATAKSLSIRRSVRIAFIVLMSLLTILVAFLAAFRGWAALREQDVAEARAPQYGQFVNTSKGRVFLQDVGPLNGPVVLLIHGTAAWSEFWRGTTDFLARRGYRVIAIDLPPFGYSDRSPMAAYSRADQAQRIKDALDALHIERATLLGHSFGAGATVETVLRHSGKVKSLVLVAGALGLPKAGESVSEPPAVLLALLDRPWLAEPLIAATVTNPLLTERLLRMMLHRKEVVTPELAAILQRPMTLKGSTSEMTRWIKSFVTPDRDALSMSAENYARIAVPTRLIWGDRDTLTPLDQGQRLASLIPGAELAVLNGLGHIPQIEDPIAFRRLLGKTLDDLRSVEATEPKPKPQQR